MVAVEVLLERSWAEEKAVLEKDPWLKGLVCHPDTWSNAEFVSCFPALVMILSSNHGLVFLAGLFNQKPCLLRHSGTGKAPFTRNDFDATVEADKF